jgi:nicotinamide-nucleotide amidase
VLKVWGESESGLNARLDDVIARLDDDGDVTLAFLARGWNGLEVRLTTSAESAAAAQEKLRPWETEIRALLGKVVFGTDGDSMESVVVDALRRQGSTLGLAESLTAGLVAARLANVPGVSDVLRGSLVTYASDVKFDLLDVTPGPVISEEVALEMAAGACRVLGADVGLALTGVAGPDRQDDVEVGTVCLAVVGHGRDRATTTRYRPTSSRDQIRQLSVINALDLLRRFLA